MNGFTIITQKRHALLLLKLIPQYFQNQLKQITSYFSMKYPITEIK